MKKTLILFLLCLLSHNLAWANEEIIRNKNNRHTFEFGGGFFVPTDEFVSYSIDFGYNLELLYLYSLTKNFKIGAYISYNEALSEPELVGWSYTDYYYTDFDLNSTAFGLVLECSYPIKSIEPYIRGRIGAAINNLDLNLKRSSRYDYYDDEKTLDSITYDAELTYNAAIEIGARIYSQSKNFSIGFNVGYTATTYSVDELSDVNGLSFGGITIKGTVGLHI